MKVTQDKLEMTVVEGVSSGKSTFAIRENQRAVHIDQDQSQFVTDDGAVYAEKYDWSLVSTVREALLGRACGRKVLSPREADVAARQKTDLNSLFLSEALLGNMHCYIMEGQPGRAADGKQGKDLWYYRKRWNDGVRWRRMDRGDDSEQNTARADSLMGEIQDMIEKQFNLPMWLSEQTRGFDMELLKPEYMTWIQFETERKNPKRFTKS